MDAVFKKIAALKKCRHKAHNTGIGIMRHRSTYLSRISLLSLEMGLVEIRIFNRMQSP